MVMCLNSLFPVYFLRFCWCSVTLWQPAVFYCVPVLSLRTHSILKRKNLKELEQSFCDFLPFRNQYGVLPQYTAQLTIKVITFKFNCIILVEGKNYFRHIFLNQAYNFLFHFPILQLRAIALFIAEGISSII